MSDEWAVKLRGEFEQYIEVWHPDKATAIRVAQAAVDAMEVKCEST